jgi:hypothetical protein
MPVIHFRLHPVLSSRRRKDEAPEAEPEMHSAEVVATMFQSRVALAPVCLQSVFLLRTNDGKMMNLTLQYFLCVQSLPTDAPLPPMYVAAAQYPTFEDQDDANMEKEQTAERTGNSPDTDTHQNRKLQERLAQLKVRSVSGLPRDSKLNAHSPSHAPRAQMRRISASDRLPFFCVH